MERGGDCKKCYTGNSGDKYLLTGHYTEILLLQFSSP